MDIDHVWSYHDALFCALPAVFAFAYGLYLLAYPPTHKKLNILFLALPVGWAFKNHADLAPNWTVCDTFGRFLYIWLAHMSYEVTILEFSPRVVGNNDDWKTRVSQAYRVLFDRNHTQVLKEQATQDQTRGANGIPASAGTMAEAEKKKAHGYTRFQFVAYQVIKGILLYLAMAAYSAYERYLGTGHGDYNFEYLNGNSGFFRRIFRDDPSSLNPIELLYRMETAFDWIVISMFQYESYHCVFAVLFVGILRLDGPEEWALDLCGSLTEAWSVRRYWGKHWHNYIYHSFSSHTKIVTRKWLGFRRGNLETRLVENSLVFLASGLMHSMVRYNHDPNSDIWCITLWYIGQMLPIVIEGMVQHVWRNMRTRLGIRTDDKRVNAFELAVGYTWVWCWYMWSVPHYNHTKNVWTEEMWRKKYAEEWDMNDLNPNEGNLSGVNLTD